VTEIYGLFEPDGYTLRYIGKANDSQKRLKGHVAESRTCDRPVNRWIRGLLDDAKLPVLKVIASVPEDQWKDAERFLIAEARRTDADLLNVAPGGDMPSATPEQCVNAARAANAVIAKQDPRWRAFCSAKRDWSRLATSTRKEGDIFGYYCMRFHMQRRALDKPHLYPEWLQIN
jgi:hypothetical protein